MSDVKETTANFLGVGNNDRVPYAKADFVKIVVVGNNIGLGFYQLDYSAFANAAAGLSHLKPDEVGVMPISKVVLDQEGFQMLITEVQKIQKLQDGQRQPKSAPEQP